ncbi:MAG: DMT family transporter [Myxococcota bacterium]
MKNSSNVTHAEAVTLAPSVEARKRRALAWAALGMLGFSLTLTATRAAVPELGGIFVGFGRAVIAAMLALVAIPLCGLKVPKREHLAPLLRTALGIVVGFPALTALALRSAPASHAQVFIGLSPLATALVAAARGGERLPLSFWRAAAAGALCVLVFAWLHTGGDLSAADGLLVAAVALVGFGYAEGGRLAQQIGGMNVVCWALVLALPITLPIACWSLWNAPSLTALSWKAVLGFAYVSVVSMFFAFVAWYRGLGMGGVARTSQIQLAMPLLGLLWAALFLGERLSLATVLAGAFVSLFAFLGAVRGRTAPGVGAARHEHTSPMSSQAAPMSSQAAPMSSQAAPMSSRAASVSVRAAR